MTTEIEVASKSATMDLPPCAPEDIVVIANTASEMEAAQCGLIDWVQAKVALCETELREATQNVSIAKARKWKVRPFQKIATEAAHKVNYYNKMKLALEAGYTIMPDLPGIIMAVRTAQTRPRQDTVEVTWGERNLVNAQPDESPAGEGRYIDPGILYDRWETKKERAGGGTDVTRFARANRFDLELDFPVKLVKPQILEQTDRALVLKIFDEIVVMPGGTVRDNKQKLKGLDPIVLGRIVRTERGTRRVCSFLITWWLDTRDL